MANSSDASIDVTPSPRHPHIHEAWIYSMVCLGFIASFVILCIIVIAGYQTYKIMKRRSVSKVILALNFTLWVFNLAACIQWALCRTNLFHSLSIPKCVVIYIANYLCYMIAKYCLHLLLLYRLYFTFQATMYNVNRTFIIALVVIITINFCVFTALWITVCFEKIAVGYSSYSDALQICTLFNSESTANMTLYDQIWPILFGGQDLLVGLVTLVIFVKKIHDLSTLPEHQKIVDAETQLLVRKLCILAFWAIGSTFIFYTFAIPFWPNFTFLLPIDCVINSLCCLLFLDFASAAYRKLCCCFDRALMAILHHVEGSQSEIVWKTEKVKSAMGDTSSPHHSLEMQGKAHDNNPATQDEMESLCMNCVEHDQETGLHDVPTTLHQPSPTASLSN